MVLQKEKTKLSDDLFETLPFLRRFARALTGDQETGDWFALMATRTLISAPEILHDSSTKKVGLFRCFMLVWRQGATVQARETDEKMAKAQSYLQKLTTPARQALLLHANEEFSVSEVGEILGNDPRAAQALIDEARSDIKNSVKGNILIIEDEAMIAMDLQDIAEGLGHHISGAAPTRKHAVSLAKGVRPDLILSDIKLADGSSGIDAVEEILAVAEDIPVIFVTAFPELLLTGDRKEPAFIITKPYAAEQVESAISQAMFFRSTDAIVLD